MSWSSLFGTLAGLFSRSGASDPTPTTAPASVPESVPVPTPVQTAAPVDARDSSKTAVVSVAQAGGKNRVAFLDMIAVSEIGKDLLVKTDNGYNVLVGSTAAKPILFDSYADHPNVRNKSLNSTAAGRYQILYRYWPHYKAQLNLPDFSPLSQDLYALQQLKEQGALPYIDAGKFQQAVAECSNIWASLTGAGYGQHENTIEYLLAAYQAAGGTVTA